LRTDPSLCLKIDRQNSQQEAVASPYHVKDRQIKDGDLSDV
jgi:hypothetical protein